MGSSSPIFGGEHKKYLSCHQLDLVNTRGEPSLVVTVDTCWRICEVKQIFLGELEDEGLLEVINFRGSSQAMKLGHLEGVWKTTRSLGDLQLIMVIKDWVDPPSTRLEVPTIDTCTSGTSKSQQYVSIILTIPPTIQERRKNWVR